MNERMTTEKASGGSPVNPTHGLGKCEHPCVHSWREDSNRQCSYDAHYTCEGMRVCRRHRDYMVRRKARRERCSVAKARLYQFAAMVEECKGWKIELDFEQCACLNDMKTIWMWRDYVLEQPWYLVKEMFLHEVAHIGETRPGSVDTHDGAFFRRFGNLLVKYADVTPNKELSDNDK